MATIKFTEKFLPTLPPQEASAPLREWLREEFDRIATVGNAALETVDALRAVPRMFLAGQVDDINLDTIDSQLVNYTQGGVLGVVPIEPDPVAGTITIPFSGLYRLSCYVYGLQSGNLQNDTMRLLIGVDGVPVPIVSLDVNSVQTDNRSFSATLSRDFAADEVITMLMDATGDFGNFQFLQVSLELTLILNDDEQETNLQWFP